MQVSPELLEHLRVLGATQFAIAMNIVSNREIKVYCDYPAAWQDRYFSEGLFAVDPVFHAAGRISEATLWDDIAAPFAAGNVVDQARDFGVSNGISIPVRVGDDRHVVSVTLEGNRPPSQSHRDALTRATRRLVMELDCRQGEAHTRMQSVISFLTAQGMSPTQIADILQANIDSRLAPVTGQHSCNFVH